jgi:hypothetical protein
MEDLRKSVKMKKRANPIEKLMNKIIKQEKVGPQGTPFLPPRQLDIRDNIKNKQNALPSIMEDEEEGGPVTVK